VQTHSSSKPSANNTAAPVSGKPGALARVRSRALLALLLASVASALDVSGAKDAIGVEDAWIRWLPANLPGAGYMTLTNTGNTARTLTGASSPDYAAVGIHQTSSHDGMNEMKPVEAITVQPHTTIRFAEGGYHLMLMQPRRSLQRGDRVTVVLHFGSETVDVSFLVRG